MSLRYNIVIVNIDDAPWDCWSHMPLLQARTDLVRFSRGVVTTPVCGPSRASMWTGQYVHHHGVNTNEFGKDFTNAGLDPLTFWPKRVQQAGYTTGHFGKYMNGYPWDGEGEGGFYQYMPPGWNEWRAVRGGNMFSYPLIEKAWNSQTKQAVNYGTAAADYLTDVLSGHVDTFAAGVPEPFALYFAPVAPHLDPNDVPPRHAALYAGEPMTHDADYNPADMSTKPSWFATKKPAQLTAPEVDEQDERHRISLRKLRGVDDAVDSLLATLATRGVLDRTVFMFCADNSNLFGEWRWTQKYLPYRKVINGQWAVRWPGVAGGTNGALVANIDVAPTVCDIAGATMPKGLDGMSLVPTMESGAAFRSDLLIEDYEDSGVTSEPWRGVVTVDDRKWVEYLTSGDTERYDLATDPLELTNLAPQGDAGMASKLDRLLA